jgi:hypothetical protein
VLVLRVVSLLEVQRFTPLVPHLPPGDQTPAHIFSVAQSLIVVLLRLLSITLLGPLFNLKILPSAADSHNVEGRLFPTPPPVEIIELNNAPVVLRKLSFCFQAEQKQKQLKVNLREQSALYVSAHQLPPPAQHEYSPGNLLTF